MNKTKNSVQNNKGQQQVANLPKSKIEKYEAPYLIRYSKTVKDKNKEIVSAIRCGGYCGQCSAHYYSGC